MFKKGQLVRSKETEGYYVVRLSRTTRLGEYLGVLNIALSEKYTIFGSQVELIGNNYRPFNDPRAWAAQKAKE